MSQNPTPTSNIHQGRQILEQLQRESDKRILVDFVRPDCVTCKILKPILHQLVSDQNGAFHLAEIDVAEELELGTEMGVYSTPTLLLFKQKQVLTTLVGLQPKKRYVEAITQFS